MERELVEQSLARLVNTEGQVVPQHQTGNSKEGRELRDDVWWEAWMEMGCDLERGGNEVWPVGKMRRRLAGSM
jgi:hypothetical protein